jgi:hypothetical protein
MILAIDKVDFLSLGTGDTQGHGFLECFLERLFQMRPDSDRPMQQEDKKDVVMRLLNLLMMVSLKVPLDYINDCIKQMREPLEKLALQLLEGEGTDKKDPTWRMFCSAEAVFKECRALDEAANSKSARKIDLGSDEKRLEALFLHGMAMVLPFLPEEVKQPLFHLLLVLLQLGQFARNPTKAAFRQHKKVLVKRLTSCLSLPDHTVQGIFALSEGRWSEAVEFCRPFCKLNPVILDQLIKLLPIVKNMSSGNPADLLQLNKSNPTADAKKSRVAESVSKKECVLGDLFGLVDLDGNGTVSLQEFTMCCNRLGLPLGEHRIMEVFSVVKKGKKSDDQELDEEEFKLALDYLKDIVVKNSMAMLGTNASTLAMMLVALVLLLIMLIVFIMLGVNAFVTGSSFNSVINSAMTVGAGLGVGKANDKADSESTNSEKTREMVELVKDTIFDA